MVDTTGRCSANPAVIGGSLFLALIAAVSDIVIAIRVVRRLHSHIVETVNTIRALQEFISHFLGNSVEPVSGDIAGVLFPVRLAQLVLEYLADAG